MIALLFADGVLNWLQNIIAFSVLSLVSPLTYSVASASKRVFVIAVSLFILGNPVTWMNIFGMMLAVLGVLAYNRVIFNTTQNRVTVIMLNVFSILYQAKHLSRQKRSTLLPTVVTPTNGKWDTFSPNSDAYSPKYAMKPKTTTITNNVLLNGGNQSRTSTATRLMFI